MGKFVDLTGKRFGMLTVVMRDNVLGNHPKWYCLCDCGKTSSVFGHCLREGHTQSCGCIRSRAKEVAWIEKPCIYPELGDCHICTSHAKTPYGYPVRRRNGKLECLSHVVYEKYNNCSITSGTCTRHKCDTPGCINPEHLEIGTKGDNNKDRVERGRSRTIVTREMEQKIIKSLLSHRKTAKLCGVSKSTVTRIKSGKLGYLGK